jgi:hypothetical protein
LLVKARQCLFSWYEIKQVYRIVLEYLAVNSFGEELSLVVEHEFPSIFTRIETKQKNTVYGLREEP